MSFWRRYLDKFLEEESYARLLDSGNCGDFLSARELGQVLLRIARGSDEEDAAVLEHFKNGGTIDTDHVRIELMCLRAFIVDLAVWATVKDEVRKRRVLEAFYNDAMGEIAEQGPAGAAFVEHIKNRIAAYAEAIREPSDLGPSWPVGKAFAKFCGSQSVHDIMPGSIEFSTSLNVITRLLKRNEVTN